MTETLTLPTRAETRDRRIPVAVLGATGSVGQRFVQLLEAHPWFRLHEVVASERSAGRAYGDAAGWRLDTLLPTSASELEVMPLGASLESRLVFSGLDSSVAGEAEDDYANRGCVVVSNSRNHRMDTDVPLLIPEINADHLGAIKRQKERRGGNGYIVTNPNCSTIGLAMAIAPIERAFGIDQLHVTTMQAISGAGYAGVSSYAILDNVIPFIGGGEEEKIETEPRKILGRWDDDRFIDAPFRISAQVNRVATIDGHLMTISLKLRDGAVDLDAIRDAIRNFTGEPQHLNLPSAPKQPVHYVSEQDRPQPRLDRERERGMAVTVGRLRPCPLLDIRMVALVHNTIRGAAGAALLNAELLDAKGML
ncbi:MAG TPA: aspartate-semialdehyde dehydrogenase [Thermoanaerobaculia bacterium]|jgi:aspartate-semialdehyde dehydrogenase|nr:aspartate-semialdehyde dehydrogenase [Thermoanaerobaculia bacterium]